MTDLPPESALFRRWLRPVGTIDDAADLTGLSRRALQRMYSGAAPPTLDLLDRLIAQLPGLATPRATRIHADLVDAAAALRREQTDA